MSRHDSPPPLSAALGERGVMLNPSHPVADVDWAPRAGSLGTFRRREIPRDSSRVGECHCSRFYQLIAILPSPLPRARMHEVEKNNTAPAALHGVLYADLSTPQRLIETAHAALYSVPRRLRQPREAVSMKEQQLPIPTVRATGLASASDPSVARSKTLATTARWCPRVPPLRRLERRSPDNQGTAGPPVPHDTPDGGASSRPSARSNAKSASKSCSSS
ncbi:hypothetical protein HPB51_002944 [Rhipicephalus microplus]|uniref:Uncharacterized protein n=1 Tax=Rhipicephalus microplus TaxID=6941 RepID=A0A9J6DT68_RHIMP|nr:hypothetical protein HPB51_002944 [Rhipicephalus microplus]